MTVIEIKPHRWGWKVFEAPGVEILSSSRRADSVSSDRTPLAIPEVRQAQHSICYSFERFLV
jgi:hypothetical protein